MSGHVHAIPTHSPEIFCVGLIRLVPIHGDISGSINPEYLHEPAYVAV